LGEGDGKTDRHFDVDKEENFRSQDCRAAKECPGDYTFRLDAVWSISPIRAMWGRRSFHRS